MNKFLVVWCSPHNLTVSQMKELEEKYDSEVVNLKDLNRELFIELQNSPGDFSGNLILADNFLFILSSLSDRDIIIVQPAGSIVFQIALFRKIFNFKKVKAVLYSYSERIAEDVVKEDGSVEKISVFKHSHFIEIESK